MILANAFNFLRFSFDKLMLHHGHIDDIVACADHIHNRHCTRVATTTSLLMMTLPVVYVCWVGRRQLLIHRVSNRLEGERLRMRVRAVVVVNRFSLLWLLQIVVIVVVVVSIVWWAFVVVAAVVLKKIDRTRLQPLPTVKVLIFADIGIVKGAIFLGVNVFVRAFASVASSVYLFQIVVISVSGLAGIGRSCRLLARLIPLNKLLLVAAQTRLMSPVAFRSTTGRPINRTHAIVVIAGHTWRHLKARHPDRILKHCVHSVWVFKFPVDFTPWLNVSVGFHSRRRRHILFSPWVIPLIQILCRLWDSLRCELPTCPERMRIRIYWLVLLYLLLLLLLLMLLVSIRLSHQINLLADQMFLAISYRLTCKEKK